MNSNLARILALRLSPQGRSVRIWILSEDTHHVQTCAMTPDEVINRDLRVGDTVVLGARLSGRPSVFRPVLERRPADAVPFRMEVTV